jgi:hypothetical protein
MAADDGAIGAQRGPPLDQCRRKLVLAFHEGARRQHIGEHHAGAAEDVVFQRHTLVDRNVVLDLAAVADHDVRSDADVLADRAVRTDAAIAQNVGEVPYFRHGANNRACINDGGFMNECAGINPGHASLAHHAPLTRPCALPRRSPSGQRPGPPEPESLPRDRSGNGRRPSRSQGSAAFHRAAVRLSQRRPAAPLP